MDFYCVQQQLAKGKPTGCNTVRFFASIPVWPARGDAFDVVAELTFSKPLGFLEKGLDIDGIIVALEKKMLDNSGKDVSTS